MLLLKLPSSFILWGRREERDGRSYASEHPNSVCKCRFFLRVAANSSEETPWAFGRHGQGSSQLQCFPVGSEPSVQWIIYRWTGVPGRAGQCRQSCFIRSQILCLHGSTQVLHLGSPGKDRQSPTVYESAWKIDAKRNEMMLTHKRMESIAIHLWDFYYLFRECHSSPQGLP